MADSDAAPTSRKPKWQVYSDDNGNMYFYNSITGETTWELPQEEPSDDEANDSGDDGPLAEAVAMTATGDAMVSKYMRDADGNLMEFTVVRPKGGGFSDYQIAAEVVEVMLHLMDTTEELVCEEQARTAKAKKKKPMQPAAQARAKKNEANLAKKRKRERILAETMYMNILIPPVATSSNAATVASSLVQGKRPVGALFSRDDAKRWRLEREVAQIRKRYAVRKKKDQHHDQVYARATHEKFLKQFRIELMQHFIAQIPYSSELQQQRIMLLSSPQQLAETELLRKAHLEPEVLERYEADRKKQDEDTIKNIRKVFVLTDHSATGSLHLLQVLFSIFADERAQKYATKVRGLAGLLESVEIQRFVVDYVATHQPQDCRISLTDFHEFVRTIEEVLTHYMSVQEAVKAAEEEIAAALEAAAHNGSSSGSSLLRARLNMVSKKKVEQEVAALKATQQDLATKKRQEKQAALRKIDDSESLLHLLAPKEEWERNHQHRYIQIEPCLPVYCCLCRRRKWELWRRQWEEEESDFRATYTSRYAVKMKNEELRLMDEQDGKQHDEEPIHEVCDPEETMLTEPTVDVQVEPLMVETSLPVAGSTLDLLEGMPGEDDDLVVLQVVRLLVIMTERLHSSDAMKSPRQAVQHHDHRRRPAKQQQTGSPRKKKKPKIKTKNKTNQHKSSPEGEQDSDDLDELQLVMKQFEKEDQERKILGSEDSAMQIYLERNRRAIERPLLFHQDAAHNAYILLLSHCVNPCSLLYRLQFERCLSFDAPQHLVLLMADGAAVDTTRNTPSRSVILQTVPCRTEQEASYLVQQAKQMQAKLQANPYIAQLLNCSKHTYQFFAESGMLIEQWPVVFVVVECFAYGSWRQAFANAIADATKIKTFFHAEAQIIGTFRSVAAGLAAMHSCGILHLNFNLDNLYLLSSGHEGKLQIGGLLAWKRSFDEHQLQHGEMANCLDPAVIPPEAMAGQPVTSKADVWMLGCALYDALMIWQHHQLSQRGSGEPIKIVVRLKPVADILQEIPLLTSASLRSLLRMLLQQNPSQRPQMSQVVDILSFAGNKSGTM